MINETYKNQKTIVVDLGGTLAHRGDRPKEAYMERFHEDIVDKTVRDLVNLEHATGTLVIVLTGQREKSRKITLRWLANKKVHFDMLIMKKDDDTRDTLDFKKDFYLKVLNGCVDLKYVLEDREEIVEMWRSMRVKCLQTASGQDREHYKKIAIDKQKSRKEVKVEQRNNIG
jgi:hypothetical protein